MPIISKSSVCPPTQQDFLDTLCRTLHSLREAGVKSAELAWHNLDGSPCVRQLGQETAECRVLHIEVGSHTSSLTLAWTGVGYLNEEIAELLAPDDMQVTYIKPQTLDQAGDMATPERRLQLDTPNWRRIAMQVVPPRPGAHPLLKVSLLPSVRSGKAEMRVALPNGVNRAAGFSDTTSVVGLTYASTDHQEPGAAARRHALRIVVQLIDDSSQRDGSVAGVDNETSETGTKLVRAAERAGLELLHALMQERIKAGGYAWISADGAADGLYRKYGRELGVAPPPAPDTCRTYDNREILTPGDAVTVRGPLCDIVDRALREARNQRLSVQPATTLSNAELPSLRVVSTEININDADVVVIPAPQSEGAARIAESRLGPVRSIKLNLAVTDPDGTERQRLAIPVALYCDRDMEHAIVVYEVDADVSLSELQERAAAVAPMTPDFQRELGLTLRERSDLDAALRRVHGAVKSARSTGDPERAARMAAEFCAQVQEYITSALS